MRAAEAHDIAVCLHTDGLNESTELEGTVAAIAGRTIHAYHVEGSGGGHIPDLLGLVREPNIFCSSTTPTLPYGPATAAEQLDMKLIVHEGNPALPEDVAAARELVHPATMAAEGPLHDLGAIPIVNSDSQGMGRIGETIRRTFQLADAMKRWRRPRRGWRPRRQRTRAPLSREVHRRARDRARHLDEVGSLAPGRLADIVLWEPAPFGVKPLMVIKGGVVAWSAMGEGNASVHGAEPTRYGPDWGALGSAPARLATTFVSQAALDAGFAETTARSVAPVRGTRGIARDALSGTRPRRATSRSHRSTAR